MPVVRRRVGIHIAARMVGQIQPHQHKGITNQRAAIGVAVLKHAPAQVRATTEGFQTAFGGQNPRQAGLHLHLPVCPR